tara:strand:+ start:973 stop:1167 length:195 start_codon:yes stop_codon:yes gene_type:complete
MDIEKVLREQIDNCDVESDNVKKILEICDNNFTEDSSASRKRSTQISKIIDEISKKQFDQQQNN